LFVEIRHFSQKIVGVATLLLHVAASFFCCLKGRATLGSGEIAVRLA